MSRAIAQPKSDLIREDRILNEVVVDAYGPEERAMAWYYYLENKNAFLSTRVYCDQEGWRWIRMADCCETFLCATTSVDILQATFERSA